MSNGNNGGEHKHNKRKVYKDPKSAAHRKAKKEVTHYKYIPQYLARVLGDGHDENLENKLEERNKENWW